MTITPPSDTKCFSQPAGLQYPIISLSLQWLPVDFKILVLTRRALNGRTPDYIDYTVYRCTATFISVKCAI